MHVICRLEADMKIRCGRVFLKCLNHSFKFFGVLPEPIFVYKLLLALEIGAALSLISGRSIAVVVRLQAGPVIDLQSPGCLNLRLLLFVECLQKRLTVLVIQP